MVTVPSWTSPPTKASGDTVTAADVNAALDDVRWFDGPPACVLRRSANQSITTTTWTNVTFDEADYYDPFDMHSPTSNPTRITIPSGAAGVYLITATFYWAAAPGWLGSCRFRVNGATIVGENGTANNALNGCASTHWSCAAGDYIEMQVFQNSGGTVTLSGAGAWAPLFSAVWLGAVS